jgi:hypothetical protein
MAGISVRSAADLVLSTSIGDLEFMVAQESLARAHAMPEG